MYSNALTVIFPILLNYITANEDLVQWEEIGECFRKAVKRADCESLSPGEIRSMHIPPKVTLNA